MNANCIVCAALSKADILERVRQKKLFLCSRHFNPNSLTVYFCCCGTGKILYGNERIEFLEKMPLDMSPLFFGGTLIVSGGDHGEQCKKEERRLFAVYPDSDFGINATIN